MSIKLKEAGAKMVKILSLQKLKILCLVYSRTEDSDRFGDLEATERTP